MKKIVALLIAAVVLLCTSTITMASGRTILVSASTSGQASAYASVSGGNVTGLGSYLITSSRNGVTQTASNSQTFNGQGTGISVFVIGTGSADGGTKVWGQILGRMW